MKKYIYILIALFFYTASNAQIVNIPDANFKFTLVNLPCVDTNNDGMGDSDADTNDDGEIQVSEAEAVQGLYFLNQGIISLEGIQSFITLKGFGFGGDEIINVDLTQNLLLESLSFNSISITSIDISQNINLIELRIGETQITELVLTNNQQLLILECTHSPITTIDISQNINLIELGCTYTPLTEIDLSGNPNLEDVLVRFNQLTSLDVSNLPNLRELDFNLNQVTELDVANNPNLESLIADDNLITSLDVSQNPNLFRVTISNNNLTNLNLKNGNTNNIFKMWAHDNSNLTCIQVDDVTYPSTQVCTSSNGWCKDDIAIYSEDCSLGVDDVLATQITVYPNPTQNVLAIENSSNINITTIKVYDIQGRLVLQKNNPSSLLNISHLDNGLLFVQLETENGQNIVKKIIKQ